ncbi:S16 family serine protease [Sporosarcina sp. G11-34]|uniref:S16 family serine protease n=1 Tax=Sporosarcina sp. G11-34 TaxID=2849605 RepID=UPI0022A9B639|nr:S16 family serine protease [Sporosarcina sp. G11-34]MCZ2260277.1 hypothetical protein [Sporosarcina sp. G11-34]
MRRKSMLSAFLHSVLLVVPAYALLLVAYYMDFINGFVFLGTMLVILVTASILLIIFRKNKFKAMVIIFVVLLSLLLFGFELRLLNYESNTYLADGFREPEELLVGSGIHILSLALYDIHFLEDEEMIKDIYERDNVQIFDLYKIKNRDRYMSKLTELKQFVGFGQDDFQVMGENVNNFINEDIPLIDEFLSRDALSGDSAGLALGLTAMIYQGTLEKTFPIGVTGTLEPNGDIREVTGIRGKIIISEQSDLPYIMIPLANLKEAEAVKSQENLTIEIIPVSHVDEAVSAIKELNAMATRSK